MGSSLESFSRRIFNALHDQQSHILQALTDHSYDIHRKLSAIQDDVESLRNETSSQQNAFRSAFDIVAAKLDEILQVSQTPRPDIAPTQNKGTNEECRMLLDAINTRMEITEKRLGKSMGDVTMKVQAVEHNVAEIFETVKNPRASCSLTSPDSIQAPLAELRKMVERLSQGTLAPQPPVTRVADPSLPSPAQSESHKTPPNGIEPPEAAPVELEAPVELSSSPPKPSQACEPKSPKSPKEPVGDVRWSPRLDTQVKSNIDALLSASSSLTELDSLPKRSPSPSMSASKKGKELILHSLSTLSVGLGKRKRGGGAPKRRKKGASSLNTNSAVKGKEIVLYDESDQLPVMVMCNKCNGWYHIKCVSIDENDPCMTREDVPYNCPPCSFPNRYTAAPREGEYDCGAPGCVIPKRRSGDEVYYIDKLVGRKPINDRNSSAQFAWLVKFEGYPIGACLWKPEDTFDAKAPKLDFYAAATKEGILASASDHEILLLREAADYGGTWGDDEA